MNYEDAMECYGYLLSYAFDHRAVLSARDQQMMYRAAQLIEAARVEILETQTSIDELVEFIDDMSLPVVPIEKEDAQDAIRKIADFMEGVGLWRWSDEELNPQSTA